MLVFAPNFPNNTKKNTVNESWKCFIELIFHVPNQQKIWQKLLWSPTEIIFLISNAFFSTTYQELK